VLPMCPGHCVTYVPGLYMASRPYNYSLSFDPSTYLGQASGVRNTNVSKVSVYSFR
jgi:hypothetical protein